jgi:hypothetical protein
VTLEERIKELFPDEATEQPNIIKAGISPEKLEALKRFIQMEKNNSYIYGYDDGQYCCRENFVRRMQEEEGFRERFPLI